ncbi:hypothetical protein [Methylosinus sp. PW1]|uniref:hypothetical protein n=1 Tax=Methylosinus sp. PW1 TaxID=107636 RepID=UPI000AD698B4|nr:hypothetical protein [Methylosinus sp. PW1]
MTTLTAGRNGTREPEGRAAILLQEKPGVCSARAKKISNVATDHPAERGLF